MKAYIRNMKVIGYSVRNIANSNKKSFRLYRGNREYTLVPIDELHYLIREYRITQEVLMGMVHLSDVSYKKIGRDVL